MAVRQAQVASERVETLLGELRRSSGARTAAAAEELVGCLVELYGAGLERIVDLVGKDAEAGPRLLDQLTADPLVESLLLIHDLHPVDVDTRVQRALDRVRPYLGSHAGGVGYHGVDSEGVAHLTLEGSCNGCPSSTVTVRLTIEQAIVEAAPEIVRVDVEGVAAAPTGPPLLQITRRPGQSSMDPGPEQLIADEDGWVVLPADRYPTGAGVRGVVLAGLPVVVCQLDDALVAYRDSCAACGAQLSTGVLAGVVLTCPGCHARYDVRLAGAGLDRPDERLYPLPLLVEDGSVRIAAGAVSAVGA
jgi:Fe-S cluster biogenesis protein NfuA/nitrite reductase/ring-hydroxylating ferredoxin subunit